MLKIPLLEIIKFAVSALVIIILLVAGLFWMRFDQPNNYRIQNKYYAFELKTPRNWSAEQNSSYPEDAVGSILDKCKGDNYQEAPYRVGAFRFKDQKYLQEVMGSQDIPDDAKSGALLSLTISCIPTYAKNGITGYNSGNFEIGGEKAMRASINMPGFGNVESFSVLHGGLKYDFKGFIYILPEDAEKEEDIRSNYNKDFEKIISSFKFTN